MQKLRTKLNIPLVKDSLIFSSLFILFLFCMNIGVVKNEFQVWSEQYQSNSDFYDIKLRWGRQSEIAIGMIPKQINISIQENINEFEPEFKFGTFFWGVMPHHGFLWGNQSALTQIGFDYFFDIVWLSDYISFLKSSSDKVHLIAGSIPTNSSQILVDGRFYDESDIGTNIILSDSMIKNISRVFMISGVFNCSNINILKEIKGLQGHSNYQENYYRPLVMGHMDFAFSILSIFKNGSLSNNLDISAIPLTIQLFYKLQEHESSENMNKYNVDFQEFSSFREFLNSKLYFFEEPYGKLVDLIENEKNFQKIVNRLFFWDLIPIISFEMCFSLIIKRNFMNNKKILQQLVISGMNQHFVEKSITKHFLIGISIITCMITSVIMGVVFLIGFLPSLFEALLGSSAIMMFSYIFASYFTFKSCVHHTISKSRDDFSIDIINSDDLDFILYLRQNQNRKKMVLLIMISLYLFIFMMLMWNSQLMKKEVIFLPGTALISFFLPQWLLGLFFFCIAISILIRPIFNTISLKIQSLLWKFQKDSLGSWLFPKISLHKKGLKSRTFILTIVLSFIVLFFGSFVKYYDQSQQDEGNITWGGFNLGCQIEGSRSSAGIDIQSIHDKINILEAQLGSVQSMAVAYGTLSSYGIVFIDPTEFYNIIPRRLTSISPSFKSILELKEISNHPLYENSYKCLISTKLAKFQDLTIGSYLNLGKYGDIDLIFEIVGYIDYAPLLNIDSYEKNIQMVVPFTQELSIFITAFVAYFDVPSPEQMQHLDYDSYNFKDPMIKSIIIRPNLSFKNLPFILRNLRYLNILNIICLGLIWWNGAFDYFESRAKEFNKLSFMGFPKLEIKKSVFKEMISDNISFLLLYGSIFGIIIIFIRQIFILFFSLNYIWPNYMLLSELDRYYNEHIYVHGFSSIGHSTLITYTLPVELFLIPIILGIISFFFICKYSSPTPKTRNIIFNSDTRKILKKSENK